MLFEPGQVITRRYLRGRRVIAEIEAGRYPFDGTYTGFRPDPDWPALRLADGFPSS